MSSLASGVASGMTVYPIWKVEGSKYFLSLMPTKQIFLVHFLFLCSQHLSSPAVVVKDEQLQISSSLYQLSWETCTHKPHMYMNMHMYTYMCMYACSAYTCVSLYEVYE